MQTRSLGKTNLQVSPLGFGGSEIGYQNASLDQVKQLLESALDAGLNVIDTAECYMTSEEYIGRAVSGRRKDFYLFTKCGHARGYDDPDWDDTKRLEASLEQSLSRLRTDYVDLFQLHSCSKEILEKGAVIEFMKKAKQSGKVRFIGYSGDNEAALYAVNSGAFDTLQTSVSIADQSSIDLAVAEAAKRGMGVIAKRPLANVAWHYQTRPIDYYAAYWERFKKLDYDFLKNGIENSVATALRFTLSVPGICVAIVGTQHPGRWQENARIVNQGPLTSEVYAAIRKRWQQIAQVGWVGQI